VVHGDTGGGSGAGVWSMVTLAVVQGWQSMVTLVLCLQQDIIGSLW
jgi:hypothetical protein